MDWLAAALTLISMVLKTRKNWWGWVIDVPTIVVWMYLMWQARLYGLFVLEVIFIPIVIYGIYNWRFRAHDLHRR